MLIPRHYNTLDSDFYENRVAIYWVVVLTQITVEADLGPSILKGIESTEY